MWLSCSIQRVALKAGPPCHRWVQWLAQKPRFAWELSFTTRPSPHLILMDPTYVVITRLSTPGRRVLWYFREMQPSQVGLSPSTSCDHVKGAKNKRGKCSLTPDCEAWKHLDVVRGRLHPGNKGLFFGVGQMKCVGSGSQVDRGLKSQKRLCKISRCFVLQSYQSLV